MSTLHLAGRANGTINEWNSVRHSPEKFLQVFNRRVYIVKISIKHFTGGEIGENFISGKNSRQSFK